VKACSTPISAALIVISGHAEKPESLAAEARPAVLPGQAFRPRCAGQNGVGRLRPDARKQPSCGMRLLIARCASLLANEGRHEAIDQKPLPSPPGAARSRRYQQAPAQKVLPRRSRDHFESSGARGFEVKSARIVRARSSPYRQAQLVRASSRNFREIRGGHARRTPHHQHPHSLPCGATPNQLRIRREAATARRRTPRETPPYLSCMHRRTICAMPSRQAAQHIAAALRHWSWPARISAHAIRAPEPDILPSNLDRLALLPLSDMPEPNMRNSTGTAQGGAKLPPAPVWPWSGRATQEYVDMSNLLIDKGRFAIQEIAGRQRPRVSSARRHVRSSGSIAQLLASPAVCSVGYESWRNVRTFDASEQEVLTAGQVPPKPPGCEYSPANLTIAELSVQYGRFVQPSVAVLESHSKGKHA